MSHDYKILVTIQGRYGQIIAEAIAPLNRFLADEILHPLKVSDGAIPWLDTPPPVLRRVKASRENCAKILTPAISRVLLDAMEAKDLFNGYTKEERADQHE